MLRGVPGDTWRSALTRARAEQRAIRVVLIRALEEYVAGRLKPEFSPNPPSTGANANGRVEPRLVAMSAACFNAAPRSRRSRIVGAAPAGPAMDRHAGCVPAVGQL